MMDLIRREADHRSATCFLNSLFREWNEVETIETENGPEIRIALGTKETLRLPLIRRSRLGRHEYAGRYYSHVAEDVSEIGFDSLVERLTQYLAVRFGSDSNRRERFVSRVKSSAQVIRSILDFRKSGFSSDLSLPLDFLRAEQSLLIGHNFHPTPKSRDEFSDLDVVAYSPEFKSAFPLTWWIADPTIVYQASATSFAGRPWTNELLGEEIGINLATKEKLVQGWVPVPLHPWQANELEKNPAVTKYLGEGRIVRIGAGAKTWHPTSSLRSLYREDAPYLVKFSMSLKLTNSIRHMLPREVDRGLQLRNVLATEKGREFLASRPMFEVVGEPAYLAIRDLAGEPMPETIVVCRENVFRGGGHGFAMLATLTQDPILGEETPIRKLIRSTKADQPLHERAIRWFRAYLRVAVEPLFHAQANYGIILGAHQQNLVLGFEGGYPVQARFRDCQGTGYSELGFANFASDVSSITRTNGNVVSEKMGNALFTYYLILNSTFNVITSIAGLDGVTEGELIAELRGFLREFRATEPRDPSCVDALLEGATLPHKGNFLCSFANLNENTAEDPLAIYVPVENPLVAPLEKLPGVPDAAV